MNPLIKKYKSDINKICSALYVKQLYIFGSAATDSSNEESDLDFLLVFKDNLTAEKYADNYFLLHHELEQLFDKKIDLVTEHSLSNPFFIESINSTKKLIYDEKAQKVPV